MPTKPKSPIHKTIGDACEIINRELLLGAAEDDEEFDDVEDSCDCFDQPACFDIDSVNRLLSKAAYDPPVAEVTTVEQREEEEARTDRASAELARLGLDRNQAKSRTQKKSE